MSGLYPSLEDMKVDQMAQAQYYAHQTTNQAVTYPTAPSGQDGSPPPAYGAAPGQSAPEQGLYPSLESYMGLEFTPQVMEEAMRIVPANQNAVVEYPSASSMQVAPITGDNAGMKRAAVKQGVREAILCKDQDGKMGLRVRAISKGVFIAFVHKKSPASMVGLRFGDQILQINGENVAGWDTDKVMKKLKKIDGKEITLAVRDRPFDRTLTMQKDSTGHVGFVFKEGKITAIVKDSSAARNGVLVDQQLVEINGQNVVGLKDSEVGDIISACGTTVTITIIPYFLYQHIVKSIGSSLIKKYMDHTIPDI